MTADNQETTSLENCLAALDIGSNSFHFVLARIVDEHLQILHSEKHPVRLASGLNENNVLSQEAIDKGLQALASLVPNVTPLGTDNFKAVATFTLRQATNAHQFLMQAAKVFPFDIEVISGHEEARLIYQGVSHYVSSDVKRLVLDIGGGSTECIIGKNDNIHILDSLSMGCVSFAKSYFSSGDITNTAFDNAILHASLEIEAVSAQFEKTGWKKVVGTSGTIKCIYNALNQEHELPQPITLLKLYNLKAQMIAAKHVDKLKIKGIKKSRMPVICPGLAILIALMEVFNIDELDYCEFALREGVLFDQLEEKLHHDIRQRTINSLMTRFNVDVEHSHRVNDIASTLFQQAKESWQLSGKHYQKLLSWAISLHEIGFDINPSGYHRHGRYIIENADFAGFNQEQVKAIAWLVGHQRRKIQHPDQAAWFLLKPKKLICILVLLRLALLLSKPRIEQAMLATKLDVDKQKVTCHIAKDWLAKNPIITADLNLETALLKAIDIELSVKAL